MTELQRKEIKDTLAFDMEWKKLIAAKKRQLASPFLHEDQKDRLRIHLNELAGDIVENNRDIDNLISKYLPTDFMIQVRLFINNRPGTFSF